MNWFTKLFAKKQTKKGSKKNAQKTKAKKAVGNKGKDSPTVDHTTRYQHRLSLDRRTPEDDNRAEWASFYETRHKTSSHQCAWCKYAKKDDATGITFCTKDKEMKIEILPFAYCKGFDKDTELSKAYLKKRRDYSYALTKMKGSQK